MVVLTCPCGAVECLRTVALVPQATQILTGTVLAGGNIVEEHHIADVIETTSGRDHVRVASKLRDLVLG